MIKKVGRRPVYDEAYLCDCKEHRRWARKTGGKSTSRGGQEVLVRYKFGKELMGNFSRRVIYFLEAF